MDVPNQPESTELGGAELISTLVTLTGLPETWIRRELDGILSKAGCQRENLTLDELRMALMAFLETMQDDLVEQDSVPIRLISSN
jgi:hypothetical protein